MVYLEIIINTLVCKCITSKEALPMPSIEIDYTMPVIIKICKLASFHEAPKHLGISFIVHSFRLKKQIKSIRGMFAKLHQYAYFIACYKLSDKMTGTQTY